MNFRSFYLLLISVFFTLSTFAQKPKYIFYFIGDGMGLNHVNLTEIYESEKLGAINVTPLVFSQFPFVTFASTFSQSNGVTDSAAGGTALAVGKKTKNGVISMDSSTTIPYKSIAYAAKEKGMKVGIVTSVSIDHATPAAFYANQSKRNKYYEIANDIPKSNFDFFAGSGFLSPSKTFDKKDVPNIEGILTNNGYTIAKGMKAYEQLIDKNQKIILTNIEGSDNESLKFAIDQSEDDLNLQQITQAAINSLNNTDKGFFLMVEGGKIDWSAHANDGATTIAEVIDFDKSVQLAFDFYNKHPEETLIIVTADHETGSLGIGKSGYSLKTSNLSNQKISQEQLSIKLSDFRDNNPKASWEDVKDFLQDNLGLWDKIKVSESDEKSLLKAYKKSFEENNEETSKSLYSNDSKIIALAVSILNTNSSVTWGTSGHSATYVPVYAIGAGAEVFNQKLDNTDIPKKVAEVAGLNL